MSLSERIRPNSEAAPWVCEEVKGLENKLDAAQARCAKLEVCNGIGAKRLEYMKEQLAAEQESFQLYRNKVRDEEMELHAEIMELKTQLAAERAGNTRLVKGIKLILPKPPYHPDLEPEWIYLSKLISEEEAAP